MKKFILTFYLVWYCKLSDGWLTHVFGSNQDKIGFSETDQCQIKSKYKGLDLLKALNISNAMRGVSSIKAVESEATPGWRLHATFDHVQVPESESAKLLPLLRHQFSAEFVYRQHRKTVATLLSINSPGKMSPWLRLTSHLKMNKLFLFYRIREDNKLHEKVFDNCQHYNWSRIALSIDRTKLSLYLNCRVQDQEQLAGHIFLKFPPESIIYFRQEPGFKKKLLGSVQLARISSCPMGNRPWQCPIRGEKHRRNVKC